MVVETYLVHIERSFVLLLVTQFPLQFRQWMMAHTDRSDQVHSDTDEAAKGLPVFLLKTQQHIITAITNVIWLKPAQLTELLFLTGHKQLTGSNAG